MPENNGPNIHLVKVHFGFELFECGLCLASDIYVYKNATPIFPYDN